MSSTWELKEHSTGELTTTVSGDIWKDAQDKAFKKLAAKVELPGFRKGKVPAHLVKQHVNPQNVLYDAVDAVAGNSLVEAIKEQELEVVGRPSLDIEKIDENEVVFKFIVAVKPEVTLGEYKNLDIKKEAATVSDDDINAQMKTIQERFADFMIKEEDGTVENGDTAVIDFEGFKDGVAFEGGAGENYPLEIGSGSFIPGFEEQLVGMKAEETKDVTVTFPEAYQAPDLAGQEAVFKVTVHEIKYKELPEFNDELVKQANIEGVETVEAFKEYTMKNLTEQKEAQVEETFTNALLTKIVENAEVDIPQVMIDEETDGMVEDFSRRLQSQGYSMDLYTQVTGMTMEQIREQMAVDAKSKVNVRLVLEAIAAKENLEVSEDDINTEMETIAKTYNMEVEKVKQLISNDAVSYDLRMRKALELIKDSAGK